MPTQQEQLGMDFVTGMEALSILTAQKTKIFVESLVNGNSATLKTEILNEMNVKEGALNEWKATMEVFKTAMDKADLTEDGQFNLQGSILDIFAKIGVNTNSIAILQPKVAALEEALNTEITNRVSLGESLTTLIGNVKTTLQAGIDGLVERITALEARVTGVEGIAGSAKEWIDGVKAQSVGSVARVTQEVNEVFGL